MRAIWRRVLGVWLVAVLVPSLLGGGACLSHVVGGDDSSSSHASHSLSHGLEASHGEHAASDVHETHHNATTTAVVSGSVGADSDAVRESTPHDCCPQQGSPEHCSGASGCTAAVNNSSERTPHAQRIVAELNRATSPAAPSGPANAPDVPPPRT